MDSLLPSPDATAVTFSQFLGMGKKILCKEADPVKSKQVQKMLQKEFVGGKVNGEGMMELDEVHRVLQRVVKKVNHK